MIEIGEDDAVLLCGPVANVTGSDLIMADCGHQAAISPSSRDLMANLNRRVVTICLPCGVAHPKVQEQLKAAGAGITAAQREELNQEIGVSNVDQMMARLRIQEVDLNGRPAD